MSEHEHVLREDCWCKPTVERHLDADDDEALVIIHNDDVGFSLGLFPKHYAVRSLSDDASS